MHDILSDCAWLWSWLLANNASRATAILVFITAWYAFLTWRMAKAIARQTRAQIQPVALVEFHWQEGTYYPVSYFVIKNLGTQPLLLLDIRLECILSARRHFFEHYVLWDEHIIPPGQSLAPKFDFKKQIEAENLQWSREALSYQLEVTTSDLSKQVVLTYRNIPVLGIVHVEKGMPLAVRWRYFRKGLGYRYYRLLYKIKPPKLE